MSVPQRRGWLAIVMMLLLVGCGREEIRVGAKNFTENRLLAEMFIALGRDQGLRVVRVSPTESQGVAFASLRAGSLDVYADYVSTLLVRMGFDYMLEREAAWQRVTSSLATVGITALPPLGFDDGYVVVTTEAFATDRNIQELQDLVTVVGPLRLGVNQGFAQLSNRGLEDALGALGLQEADVLTRDNFSRAQLYDLLVDGELDLVVGFRTDPQIREYRLRLLGPAESNAPNYDALPLVRTAVAERHPELVGALELLADRLDTDFMRGLVERVDLDGEAPRVVARDALRRLGLRESANYPKPVALRIAVDTAEIGEPAVVRMVRGVRRVAPRRRVESLPTADPLRAVLEREARTALVPAVLLFADGPRRVAPDPRFESIVAVGRSVVHLLARVGSDPDPTAALRVATGPAGSASRRLFALAQPWLPDGFSSVPLASSDAEAAAEALDRGAADLAIVVATLGRPDIEAVLRGGRVRLVDATPWLRPESRLALPFLRQTVIPEAYYEPDQPVLRSVAMQRVMVGPAPPDRRRVLGRGGPSTYSEELFPVPDDLIRAINEEVGTGASISPQLAPARVLQPRPLQVRAPLNPAPAQTVLGMGIIAYLMWCTYLFLRPLRHGSPGHHEEPSDR